MREKKTFAVAEVKAAESENTAGEFEIIMSTEAVDRDGESIVKGAFDPLPESIPVHAFHDFHDPVGRAFPAYNDQGQLVGRGFFANTPRAQEIRQLVADGVIGHTSVGFMAAERKSADGTPEIATAELLEVSFVSVPSNRDAAVLAVKQYAAKKDSDDTLTEADVEYLTAMVAHHEAAIEMASQYLSADPDQPQVVAMAEAVVEAQTAEMSAMVDLLGETHPKTATTAPETPSVEDGKSPASNVVEMARIRADIARLSLD